MNADIVGQASNLFTLYVVPLGWKLVGAIAVWIVGGWVIRLLRAAVERTLLAQKVDATLARYIEAGVNVLFKLLLFIAVLSVLGIETTSFAALLAALGLAIGAAWGGLLANFAAGLFLMVLRPFKVGDMITGGGVTGDVREIGLLVTAVDTVDNIRVYIGNNKLFADSIQNYTTNPYRRVDLKAQIAHSVNPYDAIKRLSERVAKVPNIVASPPPSVEIIDFNAMGTVIGVRPFCHNSHYWQVYFDTNKAIVDACSEAHFAVPETRHGLRQVGA